MAQMKEQIKTPEKLNIMGMSSLSDVEVKTLIIRVLKELSEYFTSIKKIQSEMMDILMEMNNLQQINSRVDEAKNQTDMEQKEINNQAEQQEEKFQKKMRIL